MGQEDSAEIPNIKILGTCDLFLYAALNLTCDGAKLTSPDLIGFISSTQIDHFTLMPHLQSACSVGSFGEQHTGFFVGSEMGNPICNCKASP